MPTALFPYGDYNTFRDIPQVRSDKKELIFIVTGDIIINTVKCKKFS